MPRVSVVVTTYNQQRYIGAAIASALAQTFTDREVVVIDDGSTDGAATIVASFGERIRYIRQENQGVAASRNTGILNARGELLAFLDGDDLWEPDKLSAQVEAADRFPQAGVVAVDGVMFDDDGAILSSTLLANTIRPMLQSSATLVPHRQCYGHLLGGNLICTTSQVMLRRRVLEDVGLADRRFSLTSDLDLYLRVAARYDFAFVPRPLARWRYHEHSASGPMHRRRLAWAIEEIAVLKKQLREGPAELGADIRRALGRKVRVTAREAYEYGQRFDRTFAADYLLDLMTRRRVFPGWTAAYLLALGLPAPLTRWLGRSLRAGYGHLTRTAGKSAAAGRGWGAP